MYVGLKKELTEIPRPLRPLQLIDWEAGRIAKTASNVNKQQLTYYQCQRSKWTEVSKQLTKYKQTADLLPMPKKQMDRSKQTAD